MASLIPTWVLRLLVQRNYRLRADGRVPDEWYWADLALLERGIGFDD